MTSRPPGETVNLFNFWGRAMGSFHERLDSRDNALNFLRLLLAAFVITSHSSPIGGFGEEMRWGDLTLGNVAVGGFFAISGYLITASRFNSGVLSFAWRRVLRIFPAYWTCLAVVGLVFAGLAGIVRGGWSLQGGLEYFFSNFLMVFSGSSFTATLQGAPFSWTWNGSLWTLRYELFCYVAVGVALLIRQTRGKVFWIFVYAASSLFAVLVDLSNVGGFVGDVGFLFPYFAAGALLFRYSKSIPATTPMAVAATIGLVAVISLGLGRSLTALPLAYLCLWAGMSLPTLFRRVGRSNDFSYGLYLYGFPVQQMLVLLHAQRLGLVVFILLSLLATFPLAAASWYWVERPSMSLKRLFARRTVKAS